MHAPVPMPSAFSVASSWRAEAAPLAGAQAAAPPLAPPRKPWPCSAPAASVAVERTRRREATPIKRGEEARSRRAALALLAGLLLSRCRACLSLRGAAQGFGSALIAECGVWDGPQARNAVEVRRAAGPACTLLQVTMSVWHARLGANLASLLRASRSQAGHHVRIPCASPGGPLGGGEVHGVACRSNWRAAVVWQQVPVAARQRRSGCRRKRRWAYVAGVAGMATCDGAGKADTRCKTGIRSGSQQRQAGRAVAGLQN